jgi:hypothetical protein
MARTPGDRVGGAALACACTTYVVTVVVILIELGILPKTPATHSVCGFLLLASCLLVAVFGGMFAVTERKSIAGALALVIVTLTVLAAVVAPYAIRCLI